jgi:hypothetical protein
MTKTVDFRNFLDTVESLSEGKIPSRKALNESPGDTYYVSKMKERFIAMEAEEGIEDAEDEIVSDEKIEDTKELKSTDELDDDLKDAIAHVADVTGDHDEVHRTTVLDDFKKILNYFGYELAEVADEPEAEVSAEDKVEEPAERDNNSPSFGFAAFK